MSSELERPCRFCSEKKAPHEEATCLDRMADFVAEGPYANKEWGWYTQDVGYLLELITGRRIEITEGE